MHFLGCVSRRSSGKKTAATVQNASRLKLNDDPDCAPLNHKRVARIMKDLGLCGYTRRRRVKTTVRAQGRHVFADLVRRKFYAEKPNKLYVGDITYLPIVDGSNMYLATVLDCCSRRLVGFAFQ